MGGRERIGKAMVNWLENNLPDLFPGYQLMKSTMEIKVGNVTQKEFPVVLIQGDGLQIGFLVEDLPNEEVVAFIPSSPNVWEGSLPIFEKPLLHETKLKQANVIVLMKKLGVGTAELLKAGISK